MRILRTAIACIALAAVAATAQAQGYPSRPVRIVVAYPPGGAVDIVARVLAGPLQQVLKQPVIVENRSGAGGVVGHASVSKSAPDGYTILLAAAGPLVSTKMLAAVPYDPVTDFVPIAMVANVGVVFVATAGFKADTFAELVAQAKANPGKINLAINSAGSLYHVLSELMMLRTGINMNRIPYKGAAQSMTDLLAGTVDVEMESIPVVTDHVRSGRIKVLAAAAPKRFEAMPDVPTFVELGWAEIVALPWYAFVAPAGVPREIVAQLNEAINEVLRQPAVVAQLAKQGANVVTASTEETTKFVHDEIDRWGKVIVETGMKSN